MKYAKEQLARPVMKIVRRLAAIEREEISLTAMNKKSTEEASSEFIIQLTALYEEGNNLIIDLLKFANQLAKPLSLSRTDGTG